MLNLKKIRGAWIYLCPLIFCISLLEAKAATLKVGKGHSYETIQEAIEAASDSDSIEVSAGTYPENLIINKQVTLRGIDMPVIDGGGRGHTIIIQSPHVILDSFRVIRSGGDLAEDDSCIFIEGKAEKSEIRNNLVEDCAFGIWANGAKSVKIINNHVKGRSGLISQKRGNGIHLWNVKHGVVEANHVEGARDGILVSITRKTLIKNNKIHDLRYGIHYMYADFNRVEGNVTYNNKAGLAIMFSKGLEIESNYSYDNTEFGLLFRDIFKTKVHKNVLANNEKGLFIYNSLFNEIWENIVVGNDIGSHVWAGSEDNKVYDNSFIRNKTQVKYVGMKDEKWTYEGKGNYWSDYMGWDIDGNGKGDKPYEANTVMERLIWAYPMIKLLFNSPAVQTLRMAESQFPILRQKGIVDDAPLMRPVNNEWRKWVGRVNH
ncbi:MAG: nitrous oxide reductase family maturation protein NosD [Deltaproteobacteria bacterium]|nr:nitrous oxide reductase family maturation protein NosD [Deltaproteobacteria bacterium]